jgi:hypothetical protein
MAGLPGRTGVGANTGLLSRTFRPVTVTAQLPESGLAVPVPCAAAGAPGNVATLPSAAGADRASNPPATVTAAPAIRTVFRLTDLTVPP